GEHANRLILVDYDALTKRPKDTMSRLYEFIGEPPPRARFRQRAILGVRIRHHARHAKPAHGAAEGGMGRAQKRPAARSLPPLHQRRVLDRPEQQSEQGTGHPLEEYVE